MTKFIRNSLIWSARFQMNIWNSLIGSAIFHLKFADWKCLISYEIPCLEVPNVIWTYEFPSCVFARLGSANFQMNFLAWTWKISFETANFHMNFSGWKCQISYEFACLEVHNFMRTIEIPCLEGWNFKSISLFAKSNFRRTGEIAKFHLKFTDWKCQSQVNFPDWKCQISSEFPWLEVQNFIWSSLIGSAKFHLKFPWISLIGSAKFYMDFADWKHTISYNIWNSLIGSAKFIEPYAMVKKSSVLPPWFFSADPRGYNQARV